MADTPPGPDATDRSLLRRVRAGEEDAATALYLRYADHLRALAARQSSAALATRLDPDDIVQSVFRTFFRRVGDNQYDVPAGDDLWRLFLVIALNKIRNAAAHHRAAKRDVRQTVPIGDDARRVEADGGATGLAVLRMVIDDALARLPEGTRRIVELRVEGFEVAEVADRVGRSKRSVERVLQQFRDELKGLLDEDR
ncbi:MAG: sigma-70 family RNA polymerase sigma factor [Isosphaera sp.]|nr:sigma-70 family RNA polymerase sigma factor [Isosphaera sp.]